MNGNDDLNNKSVRGTTKHSFNCNDGLLRLWEELFGEHGQDHFHDFHESDDSEGADLNKGGELVSSSQSEGLWRLKILWIDKLWPPKFGSVVSGDESWISEIFAEQEELMWATDTAAYVLLLSKVDGEGERLVKQALHNEGLILENEY